MNPYQKILCDFVAKDLNREKLLTAYHEYIRRQGHYLQAIVEGHNDVDEVKLVAFAAEEKLFDTIVFEVLSVLMRA